MTLMTGAKCQGGAYAADVADVNFAEIETRLVAVEAWAGVPYVRPEMFTSVVSPADWGPAFQAAFDTDLSIVLSRRCYSVTTGITKTNWRGSLIGAGRGQSENQNDGSVISWEGSGYLLDLSQALPHAPPRSKIVGVKIQGAWSAPYVPGRHGINVNIEGLAVDIDRCEISRLDRAVSLAGAYSSLLSNNTFSHNNICFFGGQWMNDITLFNNSFTQSRYGVQLTLGMGNFRILSGKFDYNGNPIVVNAYGSGPLLIDGVYFEDNCSAPSIVAHPNEIYIYGLSPLAASCVNIRACSLGSGYSKWPIDIETVWGGSIAGNTIARGGANIYAGNPLLMDGEPEINIGSSTDTTQLLISGNIRAPYFPAKIRIGNPYSSVQRMFMSQLPTGGSGFLLISGTAYFVYLGQAPQIAQILKHVEFYVSIAGAGVQTAEVGIFSTSRAPDGTVLWFSKIEATGTVDGLAGTGMKRNTAAFTSYVLPGTHMWVGIRTAMVAAQPTILGISGNYGEGYVHAKPGANPLTDAGPWAIGAISATDTVCCPDLRGTLD